MLSTEKGCDFNLGAAGVEIDTDGRRDRSRENTVHLVQLPTRVPQSPPNSGKSRFSSA